MPTLTDLPCDPADIAGWILRQATAEEDSMVLIDGIGRALNEAGVPTLRVTVSVATLNTSHRGIALDWRRGEGTSVTRMSHGAEAEAAFNDGPIGVLLSEGRTSERWRVGEGEGCRRFPLLEDLRREGCTDYRLDIVGFPPGTALRGVGLAYASDRPDGFSEADVALIARHRSALGLAILRLSLSRSLRNLLGAYVGGRTAERILLGQVRRGKGELMAAAILLVDLKSFTAVADREDPLRLVGWLDDHLDALGQDVERHGGEILKFTGDGFIAVFPVSDPDARPCPVCGRALAAARVGLRHNRALEDRHRAAGEPALPADLALHYGPVVYGNVGTASRLDFKTIGRAVNEASRIEVLCDVTGRNILLSDSFARRCDADLIDLGTFTLRGHRGAAAGLDGLGRLIDPPPNISPDRPVCCLTPVECPLRERWVGERREWAGKSTPKGAASVPKCAGTRFLLSKDETLPGRGQNDGDSLVRHVPHRKMAAGIEPMQMGGGKRDRGPRCLPWET